VKLILVLTFIGVLYIILLNVKPPPAQLKYEACVETGEALLNGFNDRLELMCWEGAFLTK